MRLKVQKTKAYLQRTNTSALITGDGKTLPWDVMSVSPSLFDVFTIGRSINFGDYKKHHWVNVDGADCKWWAEHLPVQVTRHSIGEFPWMDVDWEPVDEVKYTDDTQWHGSSALFAVFIALAMGYEEIVLAGCPLDSKGHWWDNGQKDQPGPQWTGYTYQAWLDFAQTPDSKRVRSLSGYTKIILGG